MAIDGFPQEDRLVHGRFASRPNRFLVRARLDAGGTVKAFMPNPGRMREILTPDVPLMLEDRGDKAGRSTRYTVWAARRLGHWVLVHTHATNLAARALIERGWVAGLSGTEILRPEITDGKSRFDFLCSRNGSPFFLEVKSCTLFDERTAMFPDAVTARGARHLSHLARLGEGGETPVVLFLVHHPGPVRFLPDYHTDPEFSRVFRQTRGSVRLLPVGVCWDELLRMARPRGKLTIPWSVLEREDADRGAYLLILRLARKRRVAVGSLGAITFEKGHYLYAGSARKNLATRVARHLRKRKRRHWHVDHLRDVCDGVQALPIRTSKDIECALAEAMGHLFEPWSRGFGSSDCRCETHLFRSDGDPQDQPEFHDALMRFRMAGFDETQQTGFSVDR